MADYENIEKRPHCGEPLGMNSCGSEDGLKKIIYMPGSLPETIRCRKHFQEAWTHPSAESAEPVRTAKE